MATMQCRPTSRHLRPSGSMSPDSGGARFDGAVKRTARRGHGSRSWLTTSFPNPASFILGQACALPSNTQGGSGMRESRTYGSVRGACSNGRPYRDPDAVQCAVEVQEAIARENSSRLAAEQMRFRIGIHVGDIIVQGQKRSTLMSASARCRRVNSWLANKRLFLALPGRAGGAVVEATVCQPLFGWVEPHHPLNPPIPA